MPPGGRPYLRDGPADRSLRPRRGAPGRDDGRRRRVGDDAGADPRLRHQARPRGGDGPRLRRDHQDRRRLAAPAAGHGVDAHRAVAGRRVDPAALGGVVLLDRLHDAYGDDIDSVVMAMVAGAVLLTAMLMFARTLFMPKLVERER